MKIKKILFIFAILFTFAIFFKTPNYVIAAPTGASTCQTLGGSYINNICQFANGTNIPQNCSSISTTISDIIIALFSVAGLAFFIMLVLSGIKIITAGGDKEKISSAQTAIIHAILGIVVVAASFLIVEIVTSVLGVGGSLFTSNPITSSCTVK